MKEHIIRVDPEKCVGCGLCGKDCPENNILLHGKIAEIRSQSCIKCGHCVAVCPSAAVSMSGFEEPPLEFEKTVTVDSQQLLEALQTRRSIRCFRDCPVPAEVLEKVIQAGRFTPTAKNAQDISYFVLQEKKDRCEAIAVGLFRKLLPLAGLVYPAAKHMTVDDDFFFKKAPAAIVIASNDRVSGSLAASNMALMAEACGLGVLYSGFFTIAVNHSKKLRRALGLRGKKAVTTLVLGVSNVAYRRTAPKEAADVRYL